MKCFDILFYYTITTSIFSLVSFFSFFNYNRCFFFQYFSFHILWIQKLKAEIVFVSLIICHILFLFFIYAFLIIVVTIINAVVAIVVLKLKTKRRN